MHKFSGRCGAGIGYSITLFFATSVSGCGGGSDPGPKNPGAASPTYSISASIAGLNSGGLVLQVNNSSVSVSSDAASIPLASMLSSGTAYSVSIQAEPSAETCNVSNGSGTIGTTNVSNIEVSCAPNFFTVGGTITGLSASGLVLLDNGGDATPITANATQFVMETPVNSGGSYSITVKAAPAGESCQIAQGSGTNITANANSVVVSCAPWHTFTETVLYSFTGLDDGALPASGLTEGPDGYLYGTTTAAGANGAGGTIFKMTKDGVITVLHSFHAATLGDGSGPSSGLTIGTDGNFYGVTSYGGQTGNGTAYKITSAGIETILYSFATGPGDGQNPSGNLVQASDGNFYGTTYNAGAYNSGAVFKMTPSGQASVIYSFNATANDGVLPTSGVVQASDGNLYGTTAGGGPNNYGTVFKLTLSGQETRLYTFLGINASDGELPQGGLIQGVDGSLYGTTSEGGSGLSGTVFKVTLAGAETILSNFNSGGSTVVNGSSTLGSLLQASDGNLYGINTLGGTGKGTVFQVTPQGVTTLVYSFGENANDAAAPQANLIQASDGAFYGTTSRGGAYGYGTVYRITPQ